MRHHSFKTQKTASVYSLGTLSEKTKEIWICLHGYGQRADYFARNFEFLENDSRFILIPEGLNRFYLQSFSGRVGATWMTSYQRQEEIADYIQYLENIYLHYAANTQAKVVLFSFSQGAATASRWLDYTNKPVNTWIIWAGTIAIDVDYKLKQEKYSGIRKILCIGTEDPFFKNKVEEYFRFINNNLVDYEFYSFEGEHKIPQSALGIIAEEIRK